MAVMIHLSRSMLCPFGRMRCKQAIRRFMLCTVREPALHVFEGFELFVAEPAAVSPRGVERRPAPERGPDVGRAAGGGFR